MSGPATTRTTNGEFGPSDKTYFGFWVYLMTDCVVFGTLIATFIVLRNSTFGGDSGADLFSLNYVLAETLILLTSSLSAGVAILAAINGLKNRTMWWMALTFLLGLAFLVLEIREFSNLYNEGNSWQANAFLSSFFTLVGTHGLHITAGLVWLIVLIVKIWRAGTNPTNIKRLWLFSVFWHFLDIVWIFIFSIVFLMGVV